MVSEIILQNYDFDDSGNLSWKLRADEITPKGNSLYLVENPVLQTIHANGNITEANTSRGFFDRRNT